MPCSPLQIGALPCSVLETARDGERHLQLCSPGDYCFHGNTLLRYIHAWPGGRGPLLSPQR